MKKHRNKKLVYYDSLVTTIVILFILGGILLASNEVQYDIYETLIFNSYHDYIYAIALSIETLMLFLFFGTTLFHLLSNKKIGLKSKEGWMWVFLLFTFLASFIYYFLVLRKQLKLEFQDKENP